MVASSRSTPRGPSRTWDPKNSYYSHISMGIVWEHDGKLTIRGKSESPLLVVPENPTDHH